MNAKSIDEILAGGHPCGCTLCRDEIDYQIIDRETREYIIIGGRLLRGGGCSDGAWFAMHENIMHEIERELRRPATTSDLLRKYDGKLWPLRGGIFEPDDVVDLYRAMMRERNHQTADE